MAVLLIDGPNLVVHMGAWEKAAAMCGDVRVPRSTVKRTWIATDPFSVLRGWRWGAAAPGMFVLGRMLYRGGPDFVAVLRGRPAVVVELEGTKWTRLIVSQPDLATAHGMLARSGLKLAPA